MLFLHVWRALEYSAVLDSVAVSHDLGSFPVTWTLPDHTGKACPFYAALKKYADRINTKYAEITELYILWSELNRRKLSPTLASTHYSCHDNAIGLVGRQLEAVGWKFSYYCQCLCRSNVMHNPHKLNTDSNRNTANIKMIKIAVEKANLCGKKYAICAPCWKMRQSHIRVKLTCLAGKLATAWR